MALRGPTFTQPALSPNHPRVSQSRQGVDSLSPRLQVTCGKGERHVPQTEKPEAKVPHDHLCLPSPTFLLCGPMVTELPSLQVLLCYCTFILLATPLGDEERAIHPERRGPGLHPHSPLTMSKRMPLVGERGQPVCQIWFPHPCAVGNVLVTVESNTWGASGACFRLLGTNMGCLACRVRT